MHRWSHAFTMSALVGLSACGGTTHTIEASGPLGPTMSASEITESGRAHHVPCCGIAEVDVNSRIDLKMSPDHIAQEMADMIDVDNAHLQMQRQQLQALRLFIDAKNAANRAYQGLVPRVKQMDRSEFRQAFREQQKLDREVFDLAKKYIELVRVDGADSTPKATDLIYGSELAEELQHVLSSSEEVAARFDGLTWRVEAMLTRDGRSVPIHLDNYDSLTPGSPRTINKLSLALPPDIAEQMQAASALADSANTLIARKNEVRDLIRDQVSELYSEFHTILGNKVQTIEDIAGEVAELSNRRLRAAIRDSYVASLQQAARTIAQTTTECGTLASDLDGLTLAAASQVPASKLDGVFGCLRSLGDTVSKLADGQSGAAAGALTSVRDASKALLQEIRDETAAGRELAELKEQLESVEQASEQFASAADGWKQLLAMLQSSRQELSQPVWRDDNFTDRSMDDIVDTSIDLLTTDRREGDFVHYRVSIVKDGERIKTGARRTLRVVRSGLHVDIGAALLLLSPINGDDDEDQFSAAPAVSAALHYRDWRTSGNTRGNPVWNFLNPGIGVHFAYADMGQTVVQDGEIVKDDPTNEVAIGGVVQLFGDLLQAGVGYNFQAERSYWFIGFGLRSLTDLGVSLPVTGTPMSAGTGE